MGGGVCFWHGPTFGVVTGVDFFRWAAVMVGDASLSSFGSDSITGFDDSWTYLCEGVSPLCAS